MRKKNTGSISIFVRLLIGSKEREMGEKGKSLCCDKEQVRRGPWSPAEDLKLVTFIQKNGHHNWRALPRRAGNLNLDPLSLSLSVIGGMLIFHRFGMYEKMKWCSRI